MRNGKPVVHKSEKAHILLTMIKKNENISSWEKNLFNAIRDVSDLDMQKLSWLGKSLNVVSSFSEIIAILYDDFDFERYMKYYESIYGQNQFFLSMKSLEKLILEYDPPTSDDLILSDSKWIEITKQAKIVFALSNRYKISRHS